jgi:hypothetical protein
MREISQSVDLLPPSSRVLAYCIMALSASISVHGTILGPGPEPQCILKPSAYALGADLQEYADLREFGLRRAPMLDALFAQAFKLACETGIQLEATYDNAASCFILSLLDRCTCSTI